jgi:hypothetical protein
MVEGIIRASLHLVADPLRFARGADRNVIVIVFVIVIVIVIVIVT